MKLITIIFQLQMTRTQIEYHQYPILHTTTHLSAKKAIITCLIIQMTKILMIMIKPEFNLVFGHIWKYMSSSKDLYTYFIGLGSGKKVCQKLYHVKTSYKVSFIFCLVSYFGSGNSWVESFPTKVVNFILIGWWHGVIKTRQTLASIRVSGVWLFGVEVTCLTNHIEI